MTERIEPRQPTGSHSTEQQTADYVRAKGAKKTGADEMMQELPAQLPRFAESYRIYIDDEHGSRMLISEWMSALGPYRMLRDFCPRLAKAGTLRFICSTRHDHGVSLKDYYGDADYPVVYWIWACSAWALHGGSPDEWCRRRGIERRLFDLPIGTDAKQLR